MTRNDYPRNYEDRHASLRSLRSLEMLAMTLVFNLFRIRPPNNQSDWKVVITSVAW